jgi:REP element-mobilizing transposase RayT
MILSEMGHIAYNEWLKTPELRPNVSLDVFVIMPNHMHGIVVILDQGECDSPIQAPMPPTPAASAFRSPSNNIGALVRGYKSSVTKQINLLNYDGSAWHRNYHEHIIRTEQSYHHISDYIINNPRKWNDDKFYVK